MSLPLVFPVLSLLDRVMCQSLHTRTRRRACCQRKLDPRLQWENTTYLHLNAQALRSVIASSDKRKDRPSF